MQMNIKQKTLPQPGNIVFVRSRRYLVEWVETDDKHGSVLQLACLDDDAQGQLLQVIWELELDAKLIDDDTGQTIGQRGFDSPQHFSAYYHTLRWNCVTATDPTLFQAPFRAGIRLDAYQLEPLRKALLLPRVNLFIADDVGLGKTIEAGLIATELLLRRRVREIVVACPPSMLYQWQDELETRFGLRFEILDRAYLKRIREERGYGTNPWTTFPRLLVSHHLLIDETYAATLRDWLGNLRPSTLLILDEAHHAAPASGSKYAIDSRFTRTIRDLATRFEHRLFLSATPHNGHSNSFSALLEILDPQRFTRGVKVRKGDLDPVMVRRLKEDVREIAGGFPRRNVQQIDISGLDQDAPELILSRLLDQYRKTRQQRMMAASKRKQAEAALLISGLQQRLLSSIEAFARTLNVHQRSMERHWQNELLTAPSASKVPNLSPSQSKLLGGSVDQDDDEAELNEDELGLLEETAFELATNATLGDETRANINEEKRLLNAMREIAEQHRDRPDARVRYLVQWLREQLCAGIYLPNEASAIRNMPWTDLRVLIFTEYEDTQRYLVNQLRLAIRDTAQAEERIEVYHGPTSPDKREAIKRAFNTPPNQHPLRILVATDAAREGLNLQAHCWNLFHFDVPWNPSRLEQRNGRIDRKLQPSAEVYCHYFVYTQRPEDRVLRALVTKTQRIREELGSLSQVIEHRLGDLVKYGIAHAEVDGLGQQIANTDLDSEQRRVTDEELEEARERQETLKRKIEVLRNRINDARKWIGFDPVQFGDALSCALQLAGADALKPEYLPNNQVQYRLPNLDHYFGADPTWTQTLDTLRALPKDGRKNWEWRKSSPIRPVVFAAPNGIDHEVVQLHLSHRMAQRLLGRFLSQGFVHHDLSRACLAHSSDAVPRVVLLGRLALYGKGAARLHEEILAVTARWVEPLLRRGPLTPYARTAEASTLELLEKSLHPTTAQVSSVITQRLQTSLPRDIEELLPHLLKRGKLAHSEAHSKLSERGQNEANTLHAVLSEQKKRVQKEAGQWAAQQLMLEFSDDEKRQLESNKRYWQRWLGTVDADLEHEPARIREFYQTASYRIEPIGVVYLWPLTG